MANLQLVDDVLDFTGTALQLGKPALNDLRNGLVTAPVLYAAEEHPELLPLIRRKFQSAGDVEVAQRLVADSSGVQRTRDLAAHHVGLAACAVRLYCCLSCSQSYPLVTVHLVVMLFSHLPTKYFSSTPCIAGYLLIAGFCYCFCHCSCYCYLAVAIAFTDTLQSPAMSG